MALKIRETLSGKAGIGDRIQVTLDDGTVIEAHHEPHEKYHAYTWKLDDIPQVVFDRIEQVRTSHENEIEREWFTPYINSAYDIAVDGPLRLIIVPAGFDVTYKGDGKLMKLATITGININPK